MRVMMLFFGSLVEKGEYSELHDDLQRQSIYQRIVGKTISEEFQKIALEAQMMGTRSVYIRQIIIMVSNVM